MPATRNRTQTSRACPHLHCLNIRCVVAQSRANQPQRLREGFGGLARRDDRREDERGAAPVRVVRECARGDNLAVVHLRGGGSCRRERGGVQQPIGERVMGVRIEGENDVRVKENEGAEEVHVREAARLEEGGDGGCEGVQASEEHSADRGHGLVEGGLAGEGHCAGRTGGEDAGRVGRRQRAVREEGGAEVEGRGVGVRWEGRGGVGEADEGGEGGG